MLYQIWVNSLLRFIAYYMSKKKVKIKMVNPKSSKKRRNVISFSSVQKASNYKACWKLYLSVSLAQNNVKGPTQYNNKTNFILPKPKLITPWTKFFNLPHQPLLSVSGALMTTSTWSPSQDLWVPREWHWGIWLTFQTVSTFKILKQMQSSHLIKAVDKSVR